MLAAALGGGSIELKGRLFRELLVESKDYGTLLGAGGPLGAGGAIRSFVAGPEVGCAFRHACCCRTLCRCIAQPAPEAVVTLVDG